MWYLCDLPAFHRAVLCSLLELNAFANLWDSNKQSSSLKSCCDVKKRYIPWSCVSTRTSKSTASLFGKQTTTAHVYTHTRSQILVSLELNIPQSSVLRSSHRTLSLLSQQEIGRGPSFVTAFPESSFHASSSSRATCYLSNSLLLSFDSRSSSLVRAYSPSCSFPDLGPLFSS